MSLVWKLMRRHISLGQLAGFFFANLCGMVIVLLSIQFYQDVAPVFMELGSNARASKGFHRWAVEFSVAPRNVDEFASVLDYYLTTLNSDYEAKRAGDATMTMLDLVVLQKGTFLRWMQQRGKVGGQNKVPRLHRDETFIKELCSI